MDTKLSTAEAQCSSTADGNMITGVFVMFAYCERFLLFNGLTVFVCEKLAYCQRSAGDDSNIYVTLSV